MTEPESRIKTYIVKEFLYDRDNVDVESDTMLIDENILDSLRIFVLVPFLEREFSVSLGPDDITLRNFESLGAMGRLVERKRNGHSH
jgi:acyl carrier protein